jgi:hypothetical protein
VLWNLDTSRYVPVHVSRITVADLLHSSTHLQAQTVTACIYELAGFCLVLYTI